MKMDHLHLQLLGLTRPHVLWSSNLCCQHRLLTVTARQEEMSKDSRSASSEVLPDRTTPAWTFPTPREPSTSALHGMCPHSHPPNAVSHWLTQRINTHTIYPPFHKHCDIEDLLLTGNATISSRGLEQHCDSF